MGLITFEGSLGANLTCLSGTNLLVSKSSSYQTTWFHLLALGVLSPVHAVLGGCACAVVCSGVGVCVYTVSGRASDAGKPDNNNNAIKFSTGIACFA